MTEMTKVKMPEPVAYRWRVPIIDSVGRQYGESNWRFGTKKEGHPWWRRDNLITTEQAEAYAEARVREAINDLAKCSKNSHKNETLLNNTTTEK